MKDEWTRESGLARGSWIMVVMECGQGRVSLMFRVLRAVHVFKVKGGEALGFLCFLFCLQGEFARHLGFGIFGPDMGIPLLEGAPAPTDAHL